MSNAYKIISENMRAPVIKTASDDKLYNDFVANTSDTWLTFTKDLLSNAKYNLGLDEVGRVLFLPDQDAASLQHVWTYTDDNSSILYPDMSVEHDIYGIPNVVEVYYSGSHDNYFARVVNDDPNSPKFSGTLRPYYRADDVINMEFYVNGYVTSNKQEVIFLIPLSRPIMSTLVSISSINGLTIRQNGKYIYGSTASKPIKPSSYTATVIGGRNGLNVRAKMGIDSNGFTDTDIKNVVNNDTCAIMASIKIAF